VKQLSKAGKRSLDKKTKPDKTDAEKLQLGRRGFMRSVFGLSTLSAAAEAPAVAKESSAIFWCNLKNGQVGFPSGFAVPYEKPGSLMKLVAAAALLEESLISPEHLYECTGTHRIGHEEVHCQRAHGKISMVQAIGFSCNIYFAQATAHLSSRTFLKQARAFGLASGCAGRPAGVFPQDGHIAASSLHYVLGLAEDLKPCALSLMRMAGIIAIGQGAALPVMHSAEDTTLKAKEAPYKNMLSQNTNRVLQEGMRLCARQGTARKLDPEDKMKAAAKTGTTPHGTKFQSYVIAYFPVEDPKNAVCLFSPSGTSQDGAVPRAHDFLFSTTWP
jgi:membrane peptidoglycan carboxypeptidase